MIKINLNLKSKKGFNASNMGGFDFSKVKLIYVGVALFLFYVPDLFLVEDWQNTRDEAQAKISSLNQKKAGFQKTVNEQKLIEKEIENLKIQEQRLTERLTTVKSLLAVKKNPASLLVFLARNTPENVWISELVMNADNKMIIKGQAIDYKSIGEFNKNMRASVFIRDSNILKSETIDKDKVKRFEYFEIEFSVSRFES